LKQIKTGGDEENKIVRKPEVEGEKITTGGRKDENEQIWFYAG
jgi:hypothetical protein